MWTPKNACPKKIKNKQTSAAKHREVHHGSIPRTAQQVYNTTLSVKDPSRTAQQVYNTTLSVNDPSRTAQHVYNTTLSVNDDQ